MYIVGLDIDSRAYFTSATCAISLSNIMEIIISLQLFSLYLYLNNISTSSYISKSDDNKDKLKYLNSFKYKSYFLLPQKENKEIILYNDNKNIYKKYHYNYQKGIIKRKDRNMLQLNPYLRSMLIGILISDGWINIRRGWNPCIGIKQSIKNFNYLWWTFCELSHLCSHVPYICKNIKRGKLFYSVSYQTRRLACINEIFNLFYNDISNRKIIKEELIHYLDYVVLAHWIMSNGAKTKKGLVLCTDKFTLKEIIMLMNMLLIKLNIKSTIQKDKNNYRIYINGKELDKIKYKLEPYFIDIFKYKIHINK